MSYGGFVEGKVRYGIRGKEQQTVCEREPRPRFYRLTVYALIAGEETRSYGPICDNMMCRCANDEWRKRSGELRMQIG